VRPFMNDQVISTPPFWVSLVAGGAAGISVDVALYPLDTIKTRLQSAEGFLKSGGFRGVYKGLSAAAGGSAPGAALFFSTYDFMKHKISSTTHLPHPIIQMTAASCGEAMACLVRVPTENLKQKMQAGLHGGLLQTYKAVITNQGYRGFFAGYWTTLLREIPFSFIQFPLYEELKSVWSQRLRKEGKTLAPYQGAICGSIGGGIAAAITTPLDVAKTRIMLGKDKVGVVYRGTISTLRRVYQEGGIPVLFSGVIPRTVWISVGGFVYFGVYETVTFLLTK